MCSWVVSRRVENQDEHKRTDEGMWVCARNEESHFPEYERGYWALCLWPKFANGYQKRILKEETTILYLQDKSIKNYSEFMEQEEPADNWSKVRRSKIEELDYWLCEGYNTKRDGIPKLGLVNSTFAHASVFIKTLLGNTKRSVAAVLRVTGSRLLVRLAVTKVLLTFTAYP